jgi:copper transport protein
MDTTGRRALISLLGLVIGLIIVGGRPGSAGAHATLGSSDPPANEIVSKSPGRVDLRFTEPIEESYTRVILVDESGAEVPGTSTVVDSNDPTVARMVIPDDLPRGTYSVVWRTLSAADGHRFSGYFAFTIGSTSDVRTVIPPSFSTSGGPPFWVEVLSRWFAFLTMSLLAGLWLTWVAVIRPALSPVWQVGPAVVSRVRRYALLVGLVYLAGSVAALLVQAEGQSDGDLIGAINDTLVDTRWGRIWTLRIVLGALTAMLFAAAAWWWPRRRMVTLGGLLALGALVPLPHALISHASAQDAGRGEAIFADYVHLLAMGLWIGGLGVIAATVSASGDLGPDGRKAFLVRLMPRFSALAIACWAALGLTGLYSGYLQIGSWNGVLDTRYGHALIYKLVILAGVLVVASINLRIVTRRIQAATTESAPGWWRRFAALIAVELIGVVAVLIFVGRMTSMEPARPILAERENQQSIAFNIGGRSATLSMAPGTAGPNHFRLDIGGDPLPANVTAAVLLVPPVDMAGQKSVALERSTSNTFEAHTAEMSVVGNWSMTLTVSQAGAFQWTADLAHVAGERKPGARSVSVPTWTVNRAGVVGFLAMMAGVIGLIAGWRAGTRSSRREGYGLGSVAIAAGLLLLTHGRSDVASAGIPLDTPNPVPLTDQAVEVGRDAFQTSCIACHGVGGAGDGPAAQGMTPPPANLLEGHALYHADAEFFNWIRNGKPGTAMPGFSDSLSDEEIWSTIHYIRTLQEQHAQEVSATPVGTLTEGATPIPQSP